MVVQEQVSAGHAVLQVFLLRPRPCTCLAAPELLSSAGGECGGQPRSCGFSGQVLRWVSTSPWLPSLHLGEEALPLEEAVAIRLTSGRGPPCALAAAVWGQGAYSHPIDGRFASGLCALA